MFEKRIALFIGHFGSGKTEVAVNFALKLKQRVERVAILDFDIVNPFFRTADAKENLEKAGIQVILPLYANTNVDVPALTGEIYGVLEDKRLYGVLDVGGDDLGAKAVSRFKKDLEKVEPDLFFVINPFRPMTDTVDKMVSMFEEITESAGIRPTGLVNNSNLLEFTTPEVIEEGHRMITEVSKRVQIPVAFAAGLREPLELAKIGDTEKLFLDKQIHLPWMNLTDNV